MAKLIIDSMATCLTVKELKLSLQKVPTGLCFAYDATVQRILLQGEARSRRAFEVMKWVLFAKRPLSSAEIEHAVSIEIGSEDIDLDDIVPAPTLASLCAGLIVISASGDFRFIHQTVAEYLKAKHPSRFDGAEDTIADSCLTYLFYEAFGRGPCADLGAFQARLSQYPLYTYCSHFWYLQLNGTFNTGQKQAALQFFRSESHWRSARQAARSGQTEDEVLLPHERLWGDSMLHHAAYLDAYHLFEELLEIDPLALDRRNELGRTPLMRAAVHCSVGFARKLINAGAKINLLDVTGIAALHAAVLRKDMAMVDVLLTCPDVDINIRSTTRRGYLGEQTALNLAATNGANRILRRLIQAGAEVNDFNNAGCTALHMAILANRLQTVKILAHVPQVDINLPTKETDNRSGGMSPLLLAARKGYTHIVKELINAGADPSIINKHGQGAIHVAVFKGYVEVVEVLIEAKVDIDVRQANDMSEEDGLSPIMLAARDGFLEILETLLTRARPNVNLRNWKGDNALMIAVNAGQVEAAKLLLSHEMIDVNAANDNGLTPLMIAAQGGLLEIIPELVAKGANINAQSNMGWTPILLAADGNHADVVEVLSSCEAIQLNSTEAASGWTALHYAVTWGNTALVELLLSKGADAAIRDKINHFRAVDYAPHFNEKGILSLLEASGEKTTT
jgi:ankyrin repeat protein